MRPDAMAVPYTSSGAGVAHWKQSKAGARLPLSRQPITGVAMACCIALLAGGAALWSANAPSLPAPLENLSPGVIALSVAAALTVLVWPEIALPVIVITAPLLDRYFGGERVRHLVFVKLALFSCAGLGIAFSSLLHNRRFSRVRTPADLPAIVLVCYTALSAAYAYVVAGYDLDWVAVAGYHLSQLALYHFLVTITLGRFAAFRRAGLIILIWSLLWLLPSLLTPGRGGGGATTWLVILLCYSTVAGSSLGRRIVWLMLPFALLDTLTSGFRTNWVAAAGQFAWLAGIGLLARLRRIAAFSIALLAVGIAAGFVALSNPSVFSPLPSADTFERYESGLLEGGYRIPEALIGLSAFKESPIFGKGIGYQTPVQWVEPLGYTPVGPIHHVYYVSYLSNEGLIGLAIILWYFGAALLSAPARRLWQSARKDPLAALGLGLQSAFFGAILGAFFAGPTDGHWTWGMLGAGSLLPAIWLAQRDRQER